VFVGHLKFGAVGVVDGRACAERRAAIHHGAQDGHGVQGQLDQFFQGSDSQKDGGPLGGSRSGENDLVVGNT
jgi:hypothetical protein